MRISRMIRAIPLLTLLLGTAPALWADGSPWEYKVVILQGIAGGGTIEKQTSGIYVDMKRTRTLNELAADGWEVVSVVGGPLTDHAIYLRRKSQK